MKRLLAVLLAGLMVLSLAACTPSQDADYIIYSDNAFAPFEFMKDGAYTGVDMDLMAAIAEDHEERRL